MKKLPGPILRRLKALAQKTDPTIFVGKRGISGELLSSLRGELDRRELVKVKFSAFKDQKKALSAQLADATESFIVSRVGNVVVLFRRNKTPDLWKIDLPGWGESIPDGSVQ